jgi:hypothetical protein
MPGPVLRTLATAVRDIAPAYIHRKDALKGSHFASDYELKEATHIWLAPRSKIFSSIGKQRHVERWNKCNEKHGTLLKKDTLPSYVLLLYFNIMT